MINLNARVKLDGPLNLLQGTLGRGRNLAPVLSTSLDVAVLTDLAEQFESRGEHFGNPWAPLDSAYVAARSRRAGHGRAGDAPLRDTNRLWASLTKRGAPEAITQITATSYVRGTSVSYADFAQDAGPGRQIVPDALPRAIEERWAGILTGYVADGRL